MIWSDWVLSEIMACQRFVIPLSCRVMASTFAVREIVSSMAMPFITLATILPTLARHLGYPLRTKRPLLDGSIRCRLHHCGHRREMETADAIYPPSLKSGAPDVPPRDPCPRRASSSILSH